MNFPLQNKRPKPARIKKGLIAITILSLLFFAINYISNGQLAQLMRVPATALVGVKATLEGVASQMQGTLTPKKALLNEREALKARVRELELYALNNMILASENEELRRLLGSEAHAINQGVLARVVSYGGSFPYGTMLIELESVATSPSIGATVFGEFNTVVGRVTEAGRSTAVVQLVSAPNQEIQVLIGTEDNLVPATLRGVGGGNMVTDIARDAEIKVGDPVVLTGGDRALVGYVGGIETKPTDALQIVRVRTPLNFETLRFVRIK